MDRKKDHVMTYLAAALLFNAVAIYFALRSLVRFGVLETWLGLALWTDLLLSIIIALAFLF
jgi:hypothetical protein